MTENLGREIEKQTQENEQIFRRIQRIYGEEISKDEIEEPEKQEMKQQRSGESGQSMQAGPVTHSRAKRQFQLVSQMPLVTAPSGIKYVPWKTMKLFA